LFEQVAYRSRPHDFEIAEIAKNALQNMVDKYLEDAKPSTLQRMGFNVKSSRTKAVEVLEGSLQSDVKELKASVDNLEAKWKESHGPVS
jgi:hypothetical protein